MGCTPRGLGRETLPRGRDSHKGLGGGDESPRGKERREERGSGPRGLHPAVPHLLLVLPWAHCRRSRRKLRRNEGSFCAVVSYLFYPPPVPEAWLCFGSALDLLCNNSNDTC